MHPVLLVVVLERLLQLEVFDESLAESSKDQTLDHLVPSYVHNSLGDLLVEGKRVVLDEVVVE